MMTTAAAVAAALSALLAGCGSDTPPAALSGGSGGGNTAGQMRPAVRSNNSGLSRQEAFLARIKSASRSNGVILNARMNGDSELGVVLGPKVRLKAVRPLMTTLLREMREAFPNRPLTVIAYATDGPQMAIMRYNPQAPSNANVVFTPAPGLR